MSAIRWSAIALASVLAVATAGILQYVPLGGSVSAQQSSLQVPQTEGIAKAYQISDAFREVSRRALPAVVSIRTTGKVVKRRVTRRSPLDSDPFLREFFNDPRFRGFMEERGDSQEREFRTPGGQGSGFIIDGKGLVLTNAHVVDGAEDVFVRLNDGREFKVVDTKSDERADIALLTIEPSETLTAIPLGDDEDMQIGDWVLAFGSPFGMHQSVTQGIISAKGRGIGGDPNKAFLQTDAAVNPGNSGGPLVNLRGEVVGINTAISTRSGGYDGISLAVPVNLVKWVADQLKTTGKVQRAYVGIQMQTIDAELARNFKLSVPQGVVVTDVVQGSPADEAGFQPGDVILEVDGRRIRNPLNMLGVVERLSVGKTYRIRVLRDGTERDLNITVAERPENFASMEGRSRSQGDSNGEDSQGSDIKDLGISVQEMTPEIAQQLGLDSNAGVVITSVAPNGAAARFGLEPGMVIASMGNQPVNSVQDVLEQLEKAKESGRILLLVKKSDGNTTMSRFISVPFGKNR